MKHDAELSLGYVALVDSAPLIVARELNLFAREGLQVRLQREPSWASLRDHLLFGGLTAAHALAPLPMAATLGIAAPKIPVITGLVLSLNGNTITVSRRLYERLRDAGLQNPDQPRAAGRALRALLTGEKPQRLRFAVVSPVSNHHYQLCHWLRVAGVQIDSEAEICVVPPRYMVDALRNGEIDAFCVGEPWGSLAAMEGVGQPILSSYALWTNVMEKVLAVREDWAEREPELHQALLRALLAAGRWLDHPQQRLEAAPWIARAIDVPAEAVTAALRGRVPGLPEQADFHVFYRYAAQYPWRRHGHWLAQQMRGAGQWPAGTSVGEVVARVYRTDLYRRAAAAVDGVLPLQEEAMRPHSQPWMLPGTPCDIAMGRTEIFDGSPFGDCS